MIKNTGLLLFVFLLNLPLCSYAQISVQYNLGSRMLSPYEPPRIHAKIQNLPKNCTITYCSSATLNGWEEEFPPHDTCQVAEQSETDDYYLEGTPGRLGVNLVLLAEKLAEAQLVEVPPVEPHVLVQLDHPLESPGLFRIGILKI